MISSVSNKSPIGYPRLIQMESSGNVYLLSSREYGTLVHCNDNQYILGKVRDDLYCYNHFAYTGSVTLSN